MPEFTQKSNQPLHFILPLWGERFIARWCRYSLATLLSGNNFPRLHADSVLHIVTDTHGQQQLLQHPSFTQLSTLLHVCFHPLEPLKTRVETQREQWRRYTDNDWFKYALMTACIQVGIDAASEQKVHLVPLMADVIFSDGFLRRVSELLDSGMHWGLVGSVRITEGAWSDARKTSTETAWTQHFVQLQQLSLHYVHPHSLNNARDSDVFNHQWADWLYWSALDADNSPEQAPLTALIQRGVFCFPILMDCRTHWSLPANQTLDTCELPIDLQATHVFTHHDQQMLLTLSEDDEFDAIQLAADRFDHERVALFMFDHAYAHHEYFMQHAVILGGYSQGINDTKTNVSPAHVQRLQVQSDHDVAQVFDALHRMRHDAEYLSACRLAALMQQIAVRYSTYGSDHTTQAEGGVMQRNVAQLLIERLQQLLPTSSHVYLFGAGQFADLCALHPHLAPLFTQHVQGFLDNAQQKQGTILHAKPVLAPDALDTTHASPCVLLCSPAYRESMTAQLRQYYGKNVSIIDIFDGGL